jgi:hypothetical protein
MKLAPNVVGTLLGLLFLFSGTNYFFHYVPMPPGPPEGSPPALFMGALVPTGYFALMKLLEITGGLLVAIPKTRNFGLLVLGPIVVNILAFHIFLVKAGGPLQAFVATSAVFLLWSARAKFAVLAN